MLLITRITRLSAHTRTYPPGEIAGVTVLPTHRLIFLKRGTIHYRREGMEHSFESGSLWMVPAYSRRSWHTPEGCVLSWVEMALLAPGLEQVPMVSIHRLSWQRWLGPILRAPLVGISKNKELLVEVELKRLLMSLFMQGQWHFLSEKSTLPKDGGLYPVVDYMRDHLHEPGLLGRLPREVGISPNRLRTRFRAGFGASPGHYLETLRMQKARFLLLTTTLSIKEVALQTGFEDALYFSRRYRKYWRQPPAKDRAPSP